MADIDKGLPNTRTKLDIPSDEEIAEEVAVQEPQEQNLTSQRMKRLKKLVLRRR